MATASGASVPDHDNVGSAKVTTPVLSCRRSSFNVASSSTVVRSSVNVAGSASVYGTPPAVRHRDRVRHRAAGQHGDRLGGLHDAQGTDRHGNAALGLGAEVTVRLLRTDHGVGQNTIAADRIVHRHRIGDRGDGVGRERTGPRQDRFGKCDERPARHADARPESQHRQPVVTVRRLVLMGEPVGQRSPDPQHLRGLVDRQQHRVLVKRTQHLDDAHTATYIDVICRINPELDTGTWTVWTEQYAAVNGGQWRTMTVQISTSFCDRFHIGDRACATARAQAGRGCSNCRCRSA